MKDYSVLAGSLGTPRPKPPCEPQLKPFTDEPWSKALSVDRDIRATR